MDPRVKAEHARRLLNDDVLAQVIEDAREDLAYRALHEESAEQREMFRSRLLGVEEILDRLRYLETELDMEAENLDTLD